MLRVTGIDHIVLRVSDVERSLDFYVNKIGLEPYRVEMWRNGEVRFPSVRVSEGTIIDLFPFDHQAEVANGNLDH
jgi:catechol 2,3-dioxygenase-like lactoylglutathione lyase family enzyme